MNKRQKTLFRISLTSVVVLPLIYLLMVMLAGCATPTDLERRLFDVRTNPPVVITATNVIPVNVFQTNLTVVTITNIQGVVEMRTNVIVIPTTVYETNLVSVTNAPQSYTLTPGQTANSITEIGTSIGNLFGVGGAVGSGLALLWGLWASLRSSKRYTTAANLAQTIEMMRSFIRQLPDGQSYDTAFVQWMQGHQAEAGVLNDVVTLIGNEVSNPDAQVAAQRIKDILNHLRGVTTPPATPPA